jgi:hypothetical protein
MKVYTEFGGKPDRLTFFSGFQKNSKELHQESQIAGDTLELYGRLNPR